MTISPPATDLQRVATLANEVERLAKAGQDVCAVDHHVGAAARKLTYAVGHCLCIADVDYHVRPRVPTAGEAAAMGGAINSAGFGTIVSSARGRYPSAL